MRVAYFVSRFPQLSETFVLREINELERVGIEVVLCPLLRQAQPVTHPTAKAWVDRAWYTPFVSPALLRDATALVARDPMRALRAYGYAIRRTSTTPNLLTGTAGIAIKSASLARRLRAAGVQHVHAHFATHPTTAAWLVSQLAGIGYSFTAHAHDIYVHTAMLSDKIRAARFVVTISEYNRRLLEQHGDAEKIRVIHCGIDVDRYEFRLRDPEPPITVLCVASLQAYKGLEHLVEACRVLRDRGNVSFRCDIVGGGDLHRPLQHQIDESQLRGYVRLLGPKPEPEVTSLFDGADVFVLPSVVTRSGKMEGLPVVLMEALAAGVPAIASDLSGIPEIIRPGITGLLVPPGDAAAIADAVETVVADPRSARLRAEAGRRLVEDEFSLAPNVRRLADLFHSMLPAA